MEPGESFHDVLLRVGHSKWVEKEVWVNSWLFAMNFESVDGVLWYLLAEEVEDSLMRGDEVAGRELK